MAKTKLDATRAYFIDWLNALRLLWHVFVVSRRRRGKDRTQPIATRPAFRDVTKFSKYFWYLPMSLGPLLSA